MRSAAAISFTLAAIASLAVACVDGATPDCGPGSGCEPVPAVDAAPGDAPAPLDAPALFDAGTRDASAVDAQPG
jgi:hypothetical protein